MSYIIKLFATTISLLFVFNCASESVKYDLPSAKESARPVWVETSVTRGDTLFVVINMQGKASDKMASSVQQAKTELHNILAYELESTMREEWENPTDGTTEEQQFELLSSLPIALERMMNHVSVSDGWNRRGEVSILCALDYGEMVDVLMTDLNLKDEAILNKFRQRLDELEK